MHLNERPAPARARGRLHPLRRLLVLGVNEALARGTLNLDTAIDATEGHIVSELAGRPAIVMLNGIGSDEVRVSVWWDYCHARNPSERPAKGWRESFIMAQPTAPRGRWPGFVGATVSGWVERRDGAWLQGRGRRGLWGVYVRSDMRAHLDAIPDPVPLGYAAEGRVM